MASSENTLNDIVGEADDDNACGRWRQHVWEATAMQNVGDNAVVDVIKLILLNYSNVSIAKIVVKKIERVKQP